MEENRMNVRLQLIKVASILSLLSVSSSYAMYQRIWTEPGVPAYMQLGITGISMAAGLGAFVYRLYSKPTHAPEVRVEIASHTPPVEEPTLGGTLPESVEPLKAKKQMKWADEKGIDLTQIREVPSLKTALAKNITATVYREERPAYTQEKHKAALAQNKRNPSRLKTQRTHVSEMASQEAAPIVAAVTAAIERSEATVSRAEEQMSLSARLVKEAQELRASMEARKAENKEKRKAVNFNRSQK